MRVNPNKISWHAPTENTDGTPIEYALEYELGVKKDGEITAHTVVPAQLRDEDTPDEYEAPIEDMGFEVGEHVIALRAFAKDDPERMSDWSETLKFAISDEVPRAPFGLELRGA